MSGPAGTPGPVPPEPDEPSGPPDFPFDDLDDAELGELVLVPGSEPVPAERLLIAEPAGPGGGGAGGGLCWSFGVDLDAILAAAAKATPGVGGMLPGLSGAGRNTAAARGQGASPGSAPADPAQVPGDTGPDPAGAAGVLLPDEGGLGLDVVAEYLPGSAGLAAWLDQRDPAGASDFDLPAVAAGWRRVAAWAQAREFAAIAQIAARSAARNEKAGLGEDGRPAAVTPDAAAQVGLALALSPGTAEWWTGQAVTLTWRLPATGAALAAGEIDAYRARLIIEATSLLEEDTARRVEDDVLPGAGELTYAQLRAALRKAVIVADPEGAEDRRRAAERRARVSLYPDDDGTATLTGTSLPAPHAAAAMARITALARALKASGAGGGTDLLRAHIYLGLLLGTLPPIPPPADTGQPDAPSDDDQPPDDQPPVDLPDGGGPGGAPGDGHPGGPAPRRSQPGGPAGGHGRPGSTPPGGGQPRRSRPSRRDRSPGGPTPHRNEPAGQAAGNQPPDGLSASSPRNNGTGLPPDPGRSDPGRSDPGRSDPGLPDTRPPRPGPPESGSPSGASEQGPPASPLPGSRPPGSRAPRSRPLGGDQPGPKPLGPWPPGLHPPGPEPSGATSPGHSPAPATALGDAAPGSTLPGLGTPGTTPAAPGPPAGSPAVDDGGVDDSWPGAPLTDADAPDLDDSHADPPPMPDDDRLRYGEDPLDLLDNGPIPTWPPVPGTTGTRLLTRTGTGSSGASDVAATTGSGGASDAGTGTGTANGPGRPGAGMLDLTLSWATLAGSSSAPGILGRVGPVTATQARALAAASMAPGTRWRVVLTDEQGHAVKTATVTRRLAPATQAGTASSHRVGGPMLPLAGPAASITGRVSVTIPAAALDHISAAELAGTGTRAAILRAAARAAAKIRRQAAADQEADAGCAHSTASPAYRPPVTIRDLIEARDQTCRFPGCRQPAWRGDLDHTTPFHCGGLTCPCNLGPLCRRHHRLKQQQHWTLTQTRPGTFRWKTSAGRIYATTAHQHSR